MVYLYMCVSYAEGWYRSVPQIRPPFCSLSLSTKCRGAYTQDVTISLTITPSLPGMKLLSVGGGDQARGIAEREAEGCLRR